MKFALEKKTIANKKYRQVIYTNTQMQLVLMSLEPGEDIPSETHEVSQFIRVESGIAAVVLNKKRYNLHDGDSIIIDSGIPHYIRNIGKKTLKLYTIYSPPEHPKGAVDRRQPLYDISDD